MLTEKVPQLNLDEISGTEALKEQIASFEAVDVPLVNVISTLDSWEWIGECLLSLRAANIAALLLLKGSDAELEEGQITHIISKLKNWDQLLVHNFMEICADRIPEQYRQPLVNESKFEIKWFTEWLVASSDSRIHNYPGLPWRSYIRKIVRENFDFASHFLNREQGEPADIEDTQKTVRDFLEKKKQVICVFPKQWRRGAQ